MVWAFDEESGESDWKPVVQLFRNKTNTWCTVSIKPEYGPLDEITSTPGHKYYLPFNTENREVNEIHEHES